MNNDDIKLKEVAIATYIETMIKDRLPTESEIQELCKTYCSLLYPDVNDSEITEINKLLNNRFQFKLDVGTLIYNEETEPWFKEFKENNECHYFDRYKEYLRRDKNFNLKAIEVLDNEVLDEIMDYLGDPRINFTPRRGLVMGDVQSGKTSNYTGLICKAADAGYKAIIVLTGTVESLRQQTQKRLDEGFVGFDSDHMSKIENEDFWIGVGKYSKKRGIVLTSKSSDFVSKTANNLGFSLDSFNDTVLFVVKKNVSVLKRLIKWLSDLNGGDMINYPLLVIDEEADNASVNTKRDEDDDPTKINKLIRELLTKFSQNNYVGFTATPFANIFINPYIEEDLFPKDFIYLLKAPNNYIGPSDIFLETSKYRHSVILNDDCEEVLPLKHKKYQEFVEVASSLDDAIHSFLITNVIRDLRGDTKSHRGMLVNISRFTETQEHIKEVVEDHFRTILRKYKLYCCNPDQAKNDFVIKNSKKIYDAFYKECGFSWDIILANLYQSNSNIECISVNKNSKMINYDDYDQGARLIVVGGMALARGLTIEGLCISYLYRNSQVYDVLLQMGRWFGYRKGYEDLFKIWMPQHIFEWYREITTSVEELKNDLDRMKDLKQKPSEVGIRIRNDRTTLKITARNKMYSSANYEVVKTMFGDWDNTGVIPASVEINKKNFEVIKSQISSLIEKEYKFTRTYGNRLVMQSVPKEYIVKILSLFYVDKLNYRFDKESYINFINGYHGRELDLFDIAIIEGERNNNELSFFGENVFLARKNFDVVDNSLRMNKSRELLVNPIDTSYGLTKEQKIDAEAKHKEYVLRKNPSKDPKTIHPSAKTYLRVKDRNPLLMIYMIDLGNDECDDIKDQIKNKFIESNAFPIGLAIAIPQYSDMYTTKFKYKVNMIEQANILQSEEDTYEY